MPNGVAISPTEHAAGSVTVTLRAAGEGGDTGTAPAGLAPGERGG